jgi:SagB-type dehydrogenase family enzyme
MKGWREASCSLFFLLLSVMAASAACAEGDGAMAGFFMGEKSDTISLPPVPPKGGVSIEEAIWLRRSVRSFSDEAPTPEILSKLLWAAQGITDREHGLRSAPSAGATYPLELFVATPSYLALYVPERHCLVAAMKEDVRGALAKAALGQDWFAAAPLVFVFVAVLSRTAERYEERANLYVPIEVGCASENLMLEAAALGWGSVAVLKLPKGWEPYLIVPVGMPAR